ncbi:nucleotidyltransferase domain-containing protein [Dactylosporangium sucinum]|uniref:Amino acid transporter n=1 Tax=Dactylosporangium sucinum TaxID=1424081 RepID=A0A917U4E7_9ACTN|nr:hypothetical protein [Dactylosporangium sucinum]GGM56193.1 hypothetical protein GCM10007977_067380 [Dactylosporangium sucinum]
MEWEPWPPGEVARRLAGVRSPWYVAGGWALDLWLGAETRPHEDIEIGIPAGGFPEFRAALREYEFRVAGDGQLWPVDGPAFEAHHQTWVSDPATGRFHLDIFREPHDGDVWICRRDASIRRPYREIVRHTAAGVPYLVPELVLLFKAKATRPKDEQDFTAALPHLDPGRRAWLYAALTQVHPDHAWLTRIEL